MTYIELAMISNHSRFMKADGCTHHDEYFIMYFRCPTALCISTDKVGQAMCDECWNREIPEDILDETKEKFGVTDEMIEQYTNANCKNDDVLPHIVEERIEEVRKDFDMDIKGTRELTIEELEEQIKNSNENTDNLKKLLKHRKEQEKYDEAATQMAMLRDSYIRAGFTREEATAMVIEMLRIGLGGKR